MNKRIDDLYEEEDDDHEYDYHDYDEDENTDEVREVIETNTSDEPPSKLQKVEESRFSHMNKRFRSGEKCSQKIDEHLSDNITDILRNGISDERYRELMKDEKVLRPKNCDGLVPVQTDQLIWDLIWQKN